METACSLPARKSKGVLAIRMGLGTQWFSEGDTSLCLGLKANTASLRTFLTKESSNHAFQWVFPSLG